MPPGTSSELCSLLIGLLRRNPRERMPFETFFNHPFLQRPRHPSITSKCYTYMLRDIVGMRALNSTRVAATYAIGVRYEYDFIAWQNKMRCRNSIIAYIKLSKNFKEKLEPIARCVLHCRCRGNWFNDHLNVFCGMIIKSVFSGERQTHTYYLNS